jgi:mono/diheme cytochrome c family protein
MKSIKTSLLLTSSLFMCLIIFTQCNSNPNATKTDAGSTKAMASQDPVARGEYLVTIGGCDDCHSPKVFSEKGEPSVDPTKRLSGTPASAPIPKYDASLTAPGKFALVTQDLQMWFGPWGASFPRNLTPDSTSGLGGWTEETFMRAMRTGKHMGVEAGRPIMPPMPWYTLKAMTDEDLKSVYAYLRTIKPINNMAPEYMPPAGAPH